ncbi:mechanosensitive ion channel family protein [Psychroserpens jangbogonensis]|uniref:mechanosensitive ion channel family protein n=1 Tax=Psychroserpens jangbogonensis TaxID=1484460 RepID=UPI00053D0F7C|nr:mechanosensitive ion channel domain-containing protein [Psychroserpens jangbogonensis]
MEKKSLEVAFDKLYDKLEGWLNTLIEMIPNVIIALVVFIIFYILSRWIGHVITKMLGKLSKNNLINRLIARALSVSIIMAGVFFALGLMHLDKTVTSLLAGIGIFGLALSFAFQHTATNILSGMIISLRSKIQLGDLIDSNDTFGNVLRVGLRSTKVLNVKGQHVDIPNRLLLDNTYKEFSKTGFRRIDVIGKINFRENLDEIRQKAEERMMNFDFLYKEKTPNFVYNEIHKEKVDFTLRVWMKFTNVDGDYLNARSQCLIELSKLFNELEVEIARDEILYLDRI